MSRRDAVGQMAVAGAGLALGAATPWPEDTLRPIVPGLQLYTVRSEMEKSVELTLAKVASLGYREVEFAGYFGRTPQAIAAALKTNGLAAPSAHVSPDAMGKDWSRSLDEATAVGHRYLVVAWLPPEQRGSVEKYKRLAGAMNTAASAAKERGIKFAYHNHDFEFAPLGNTNGHSVLLAECDPTLVNFELDLYWTAKAGVQPADYVAKHRNRIKLVHVKDMAKDGSMVEVGKGTIDFPKVFAAAKGNIEHFYAEHDNPKDAFGSIAESAVAMRRYRA